MHTRFITRTYNRHRLHCLKTQSARYHFRSSRLRYGNIDTRSTLVFPDLKLQNNHHFSRPNQRNSLDEARAHKPSRNVLTTEQELEAIRKAPRGSAMGPSGWRCEHIKEAAEREAGRKGACIMIGRIANGEFGKRPSTCTGEDFRIISGARLIAIANGEKIRPKNGPALLDALVSVTWHPFTHHENREQVTNCQLKSEPRRARLAVVFNV